jgi:hypothetical protein
MLQYCAACQSALYCSKACQREDWKPQHKKICKFLNVGHGDMQVRSDVHISRQIEFKETFESMKQNLDQGKKRFFELFEKSTFEGSRAAAQKMTKFSKKLTKSNQEALLMQSLRFLVRSSNSEMLSWPNSPLLVALQFIDTNVLIGNEVSRFTLLHHLAKLADTFDYTTHENQLNLAKQLIERGANVNAVSIPNGLTPLHYACYTFNVTNLDFVELILKAGADPNAEKFPGQTPLMCTTPNAPGAAKYLLNWPTTDADITTRSGVSFLDDVRFTITDISFNVALPDNPERVQDQFQLQQWREIEEMLYKGQPTRE